MYIRMNVDKTGKVFLQQLLTFKDPGKRDPQVKWENVPTVGLSGEKTQSFVPVDIKCGVYIIEEPVMIGGKESIIYHTISALSVLKFSECENGKTRIDCADKNFFFLNMGAIEFMSLQVKLLSNFSIIKVDTKGNIANL